MKKMILCALVASATLLAADSAPAYKSGVLLPANGEAIYKQDCIQCHAADGKQTTMDSSTRVVYASINGLDAAKLAKELKDYRYGSVNKYGYGQLMKSTLVDLSYEEIDALAEYISTNIK
ncbi:periplasmic cytochrome c [Sulfurimonas gotlandica GD1]|uniref:Periplasmic cytochrome c n=1 Tax=Sulfurimonas gotlandica (strain DSM 19862 / JCM 16533 / GD1) TaxID=929558 RepID=B6BGR4_SULGG|nr:c-type cytochrome [Sulfurimonas gotlandica]EDZ63598.1 Cytochrome c subfamily protein [Sulfurimonas gotlandica GD1]EHP29695.1 periplasmic cytochrome c [Sulfurimonas gotlandica GD1]